MDQYIHADALELCYTGAASHDGAQADPLASLGGYGSSSPLELLAVTRTNPIANITIVRAGPNNGAGDGTLTAVGDDEVTWTPPGGTEGEPVTILNGETKMAEGGDDPEAYIVFSRTSATALTGTETVTLSLVLNDLIGGKNVSSAEAAAGEDYYLCFRARNKSGSLLAALKYFLGVLGTQRVSATAQLPASGAGTIEILVGDFSDWPESGWCRIEEDDGTLREIVYYSSRTLTVLTVPATGRERLGTTAAAGAGTDKIYPVSGCRVAIEAPSAQPDGYAQTIATINTAPTGLSWKTGILAAEGASVGDLEDNYIYFVWIHWEMPADSVAIAAILTFIRDEFESI